MAVTTPYSRTDLSKKDKFKRLIHKIESRLLYFTEQVDYRQTSPYYEYYVQKLMKFEARANEHISLLEGAGNYFNYNKTKGTNEIIQEANRRQRIYIDAYTWVKNWPDREQHIEDEFGIRMPDKWNEDSKLGWLLNTMEEGAFLSAVACMKARLMLQVEEAYEKGWFITFTTLTVDNRYRDEVFKVGSNIWRNYYRKIERLVQEKIYGSSRKAIKAVKQGHDNPFEFMSVVEEGDDTGQLHIHALFFMKQLPDCLDPNYGHKVPYKREIDEFEHLWEYGYSQTIAVRFSQGDSFGRLGWVWPCDKKMQPVPETTTTKLTQYMVKYILKSKLNQKGTVTPWRTRASHRMGKNKLKETLTRMGDKQIFSLVALNVYPRKLQLAGETVPTKLVRDLAIAELLKRSRNREALPRDTRFKTLLKSGTLKKHDHKSQNSGSILAQIFAGRNTSNVELLEAWNEARAVLEEAFPASIALSVSGGIINGTN